MEYEPEDVVIETVAYQSEKYRQIIELRNEVLRVPLGLTFTAEFLARDADNLLLGAFIKDEIIGCCQLEKQTEDVYQLRQMAVSATLQGSGIGRKIIQYAEAIVQQQGGKKISLHGREAVADFYRKLGYREVGERFIEIGLPHLEMEKTL